MTEKLKEQIRAAFPPAPYYGPITTCTCDECTEIQEGLRHKRWDEIPNAFLDRTCSPVLLAPEAFQAFLPAYLLRGLDDLESVVLEQTLYGLCPDPSRKGNPTDYDHRRAAWQLDRSRLMTTAQIQAIRAFLDYVRTNAPNAQWFEPFITLALGKFWK